jgi:hypothetical protein
MVGKALRQSFAAHHVAWDAQAGGVGVQKTLLDEVRVGKGRQQGRLGSLMYPLRLVGELSCSEDC